MVGLRLSSATPLSLGVDELDEGLLEAAGEAMIGCAIRVQQSYSHIGGNAQRKQRGQVGTADARRELLKALVNTTDSLVALCGWRSRLAVSVLISSKTHELLAGESVSAGVIVIGGFLHVARIAAVSGNKQWKDEGSVLPLLDTVFRRLASPTLNKHLSHHTASTSTGASRQHAGRSASRFVQLSAQLVLLFLDEGAVQRDTLGSRYHQFVNHLAPWLPAEPVQRLVEILRRASAVHQEEEARSAAAVRIQSQWRSHRQQRHWHHLVVAARVVQLWWRKTLRRRAALKRPRHAGEATPLRRRDPPPATCFGEKEKGSGTYSVCFRRR